MQIYRQKMSWFLHDKYRFFLVCIDFLYKFTPLFLKAIKEIRFIVSNTNVFKSLKYKIIEKHNKELSILMTSFKHILKLYSHLKVVRFKKKHLVLRV
jgi:hypothetical protein